MTNGKSIRDLMNDVLEDLYGTTSGTDPVTGDKPAGGPQEQAPAGEDAAPAGTEEEAGEPAAPPAQETAPGETAAGETPEQGGAAAGGGQTQESAQAAPEGAAAAEDEPSGMEQLDELIGLTTIKEDVKELVNLMKMQKLREDQGLKSAPVSLHLVFSGNPGTGKTTVARILAKIYKEIGILSGGQLIEVDRSGLVAGYIGQTAIKTQEKCQEALGGILFIDEAYTLAKEGGDFGQEAIDTILKAMEDNRKNLVVIVAGYTELMKNFINSNPGLKSRFNKYMEFPDYTVEELMGIFELNCKKYDYVLSDEARKVVLETITSMVENKGENFANAREVRNLFETIITNQASRVALIEHPTSEQIKLIDPEDLLQDIRKAQEEAEQEAARKAQEIEEITGEAMKVLEALGEGEGEEAGETGETGGTAGEEAGEASEEDAGEAQPALTETPAEPAAEEESEENPDE